MVAVLAEARRRRRWRRARLFEHQTAPDENEI